MQGTDRMESMKENPARTGSRLVVFYDIQRSVLCKKKEMAIYPKNLAIIP